MMSERRIEMVPIGKLKPDPNQPRTEWKVKETVEHIKRLIKSFDTHDVIEPIEVDENNMIVLGECRWRAAKQAGLKKIPVRRITDLSQKVRFERQLVDGELRHELNDEERAWTYATAIANINDPEKTYTVPQMKRKWKKDPKAMLNLALHSRGGRKDGTGQAELARRTGIPRQTIGYVMKYFDESVPEEARDAMKKGLFKSSEISDIARVKSPRVTSKIVRSVTEERAKSKGRLSIAVKDRVVAIKRIEKRGGSEELLMATAEAEIEPEDAEALAEVPMEAQPEAVRVVKKQPTAFARKVVARQIAVEVPSRAAEVKVSDEQIERLKAQAKAHDKHMAEVDADPQVQELQRLYQSSAVFFGLRNEVRKAYCPVCDEPASEQLRFLCHPEITITEADTMTMERWGRLKAKKEAEKKAKKKGDR